MHRNSATRSPLSNPESAETTPLLVGVDDIARLLNVSSRTVWTLTASGGLPHLRIGRRVLYPLDAVRRWTADRTRSAPSPSET